MLFSLIFCKLIYSLTYYSPSELEHICRAFNVKGKSGEQRSSSALPSSSGLKAVIHFAISVRTIVQNQKHEIHQKILLAEFTTK